MIELLRQKAYEDPVIHKPHLSTLIQQILSLIASFSGFYPKEGWEILCRHGAFRDITPELFMKLLKCMGNQGLVSQLHTGQIIIGKEGERLLRKLDFYTAFVAPVDYDVVNSADAKRVGMVQSMPEVGYQMILAGRRWIVDRVDEKSRKIFVTRIATGGSVAFASEVPEVDELITRKMRDIYMSDEIYPYLDSASETDGELIKARECFLTNKLNMKFYVNNSLFTWAGAKINRTIALIYKLRLHKSLEYNYLRLSGITPRDIAHIHSQPKPEGSELAALLPRSSKEKQKYDHFLTDELLNHEYACTHLDVDKAWDELQKLSTLKCDESEVYEEYKESKRQDGIYDFRCFNDFAGSQPI